MTNAFLSNRFLSFFFFFFLFFLLVLLLLHVCQTTVLVHFESKELTDASVRMRVWGVTLPSWVYFGSLHMADQEAAAPGELYYRLGSGGGYALRKVSNPKGEKLQPAYDAMVSAVAEQELVPTYPASV